MESLALLVAANTLVLVAFLFWYRRPHTLVTHGRPSSADLVIDNNHPLSAQQGCVISDPNRTITGIRAVLTHNGHFIDDGVRVHPVREVVFYPSVEWARKAVRNERFLTEAEQAIRETNRYPGVDMNTWWCFMFEEIPTTLRYALKLFEKLPANR